VQVKRLVEFARQRVTELEAGQHTSPSRRDTVESPIPQFLAALTERRSDKVAIPTGPCKTGRQPNPPSMTAKRRKMTGACLAIRNRR
jgi:hypothetical protein